MICNGESDAAGAAVEESSVLFAAVPGAVSESEVGRVSVAACLNFFETSCRAAAYSANLKKKCSENKPSLFECGRESVTW